MATSRASKHVVAAVWVVVAAAVAGQPALDAPARAAGSGWDPPTATADADGWLRLAASLSDYAPAGLPDFDQRQGRWQADSPYGPRWTHDGPVALAAALWWLDSFFEPGTVPPPEESDSVSLVRAYGPWDDHAPQNVRPLVADLAARARTDGGSNLLAMGTCMSDLAAAAAGHAADAESSPALTVGLLETPSLSELAAATGSGRPAVLLLGFWQHHSVAGWQRIGGHYVALEGVDPALGRVRLSDPFRDVAAAPEGPAAHNDAALVSHDVWRVSPSLRPGPVLWLEGYMDAHGDPTELLANFQGLNSLACGSVQAPWIYGARLEAQVEAALVMGPDHDAARQTATASAGAGATSTPTPPDGSGTAPAPETPGATADVTALPSEEPPVSETPETTPGASATDPATEPADPGSTPSATSDGPTDPPPATHAPAEPTVVTPAGTPSPQPTPTPDAEATATTATTATVAPEPTAPPATCQLCGRVTDRRSRAPLAAADVRLRLEDEAVAFARSDELGRFCISDLPPATYSLAVSAAGCARHERIVELHEGRLDMDVDLLCRPTRVLLPLAQRAARTAP